MMLRKGRKKAVKGHGWELSSALESIVWAVWVEHDTAAPQQHFAHLYASGQTEGKQNIIPMLLNLTATLHSELPDISECRLMVE